MPKPDLVEEISYVTIDGTMQKQAVEYEWICKQCLNYKMWGHMKSIKLNPTIGIDAIRISKTNVQKVGEGKVAPKATSLRNKESKDNVGIQEGVAMPQYSRYAMLDFTIVYGPRS
ncbi:hypothetical protein Ancab_016452 [Ancistrocladus abbreviatus]